MQLPAPVRDWLVILLFTCKLPVEGKLCALDEEHDDGDPTLANHSPANSYCREKPGRGGGRLSSDAANSCLTQLPARVSLTKRRMRACACLQSRRKASFWQAHDTGRCCAMVWLAKM